MTSDSDSEDVDTCARRMFRGKCEGITGKPILKASCWRSLDVHAERNYGVSKCLDKRRLPHHTRGSGTTWQVRKTTPTAPSAAIDSSSHNNLPYVEKRSTPNCLGPVHKQHPTAQDKPSMRSCDEPLKMVSLSSGTRTTRGKRACWHVVAVRKRHGVGSS